MQLEERSRWPRRVSPYATLEPDSRSYFEKAVLEAFSIAAETSDPAEERWATELLASLHEQALGSINPELAPTLFDAMAWAARQPRPTPAAA